MKHAFAIMLMLGAGSVLAAQPATPPSPAPPASPPPKAEPKSPPPAEPSLDDLLGIPSKPVPPPAEAPKEPAAPNTEQPPAPIDPAKAELDRQLSAQEQKDDFALAVELMGETALRLNGSRDAGIDTQRLQKQTLDKLDKLIDQARKQKSKSKSKSKSKNSDPQDQSQSQPQSSQAQSQQQQEQAGANAGGGNIPLDQGGKLNPPPGAGAAWGQLPDRLREALIQGSGDTVSSRWEALTREYYKRLAEDPKKNGGQP